MPIENRNLTPGMNLAGRYHKQSYTCDVVEGEGGKLRYRLADGREFKSPSAAGMAITGHACDGWVFWSVETATTAPAPESTETKAATTEEGAPAKKSFFRLPNQKGVPEGQVRWYCYDCSKSFVVAAGETPQACPQGHQAS